jgi:protease-4
MTYIDESGNMTGGGVPPQTVVAQQPKRGRSIWFWLGIVAVVFVLFVGGLSYLAWKLAASSDTADSDGFGTSLGGGKIGVIDVDGVIVSAEQTSTDLQKFADDDSIKAIVLHVNSPGGGAAASQEVYNEVLRLRKMKKKPIVTSIETVGASGAYYIASATDKIYANDASVVGSIGVIAEWVNYGGLMEWAKLKPVVLKDGALKEAGTPTRDATPAEQAYLQSLIDNMYGQFIRDVAAGRNLPEETIKPLATGQVWTGQEAIPLHLIDKIGTFHDCLRDTAAQVGIKGNPTVVKPSRPRHGLLAAIDGETDLGWLQPGQAMSKAVSAALEENPGFYYLWK